MQLVLRDRISQAYVRRRIALARAETYAIHADHALTYPDRQHYLTLAASEVAAARTETALIYSLRRQLVLATLARQDLGRVCAARHSEDPQTKSRFHRVRDLWTKMVRREARFVLPIPISAVLAASLCHTTACDLAMRAACLLHLHCHCPNCPAF